MTYRYDPFFNMFVFKVYWANGAQIIPPHDKGIAAAIEQNLEPWPKSWDTDGALQSSLLNDPYQDIHREYCKTIQQHCFHRYTHKDMPAGFHLNDLIVIFKNYKINTLLQNRTCPLICFNNIYMLLKKETQSFLNQI